MLKKERTIKVCESKNKIQEFKNQQAPSQISSSSSSSSSSKKKNRSSSSKSSSILKTTDYINQPKTIYQPMNQPNNYLNEYDYWIKLYRTSNQTRRRQILKYHSIKKGITKTKAILFQITDYLKSEMKIIQLIHQDLIFLDSMKTK